MDKKMLVIRMKDPFMGQGYMYQAKEYKNGLGQISCSSLTRTLDNAMIFQCKAEAKLFLQNINIMHPRCYDIVEITNKQIFKAKLGWTGQI